jgi:acyl-CoA hydrolase
VTEPRHGSAKSTFTSTLDALVVGGVVAGDALGAVADATVQARGASTGREGSQAVTTRLVAAIARTRDCTTANHETRKAVRSATVLRDAMTEPRACKRASESLTHMTEYVLPTHANALGNVFGGQVLAWMDLCAAICSQRFMGSIGVTAGIDDLSFEQPIRVGQVVRLEARGEDAVTGATWPCVSGFLTFVAFRDGKPASVPELLVETEAEEVMRRAAIERRAHRLAKRVSSPAS